MLIHLIQSRQPSASQPNLAFDNIQIEMTMETTSCTGKTIQTIDGTARSDNENKAINKRKQHQEASRRELVDKSSTVPCSSKSIHNIPGSGIILQLLGYLKVA